jgi:N6-L-threonylcarbamoyladenine synthase
MGPQYLSFSGIKTALRHHLQAALPLDEAKCQNLSASLQAAVVETLMRKAKYFLDEREYAGFALSGGVAMNSLLRERVVLLGEERNVPCVIAKPEYCTDNAGMIAFLAAHREAEEDPFALSTMPSKKIQARELKI